MLQGASLSITDNFGNVGYAAADGSAEQTCWTTKQLCSQSNHRQTSMPQHLPTPFHSRWKIRSTRNAALRQTSSSANLIVVEASQSTLAIAPPLECMDRPFSHDALRVIFRSCASPAAADTAQARAVNRQRSGCGSSGTVPDIATAPTAPGRSTGNATTGSWKRNTQRTSWPQLLPNADLSVTDESRPPSALWEIAIDSRYHVRLPRFRGAEMLAGRRFSWSGMSLSPATCAVRRKAKPITGGCSLTPIAHATKRIRCRSASPSRLGAPTRAATRKCATSAAKGAPC